MGPLMDSANPQSPKARKGKKAYSKYVKGASGRFAQWARQHCRVIVLTNPPPDIYSSREENTYQRLEEPILKGVCGDPPVRRIDYLHPTVDGAAHITYQIWPCDKTQDWTASFGGKSVNAWKKLHWSYQSLVTTSQLAVRPLQRQILPVTSGLPDPSPESTLRPDDVMVDHPSDSTNLPGWSISNTNVEPAVAEDREGVSPRQGTGLVGGEPPPTDLDIRGHESRILVPEARTEERARSKNRLLETQAHNPVERRIDFHETGLPDQSDHSTEPSFTIDRCEQPASPAIVPVIDIDDVEIGAQTTVDVDKHGAKKDFLYLTMRCAPGF